MRRLKQILLWLLCVPAVLLCGFVLYELIGAFVDGTAADWQSWQVRQHLAQAIDDAAILEVYQEMGNTSGTGNHVDLLTVVTFTSDQSPEEVRSAIEEYYPYDEWSCYVSQTEEGYQFYLNTPAPFADNIVGH